jgi:hypothetical protein
MSKRFPPWRTSSAGSPLLTLGVEPAVPMKSTVKSMA